MDELGFPVSPLRMGGICEGGAASLFCRVDLEQLGFWNWPLRNKSMVPFQVPADGVSR